MINKRSPLRLEPGNVKIFVLLKQLANDQHVLTPNLWGSGIKFATIHNRQHVVVAYNGAVAVLNHRQTIDQV